MYLYELWVLQAFVYEYWAVCSTIAIVSDAEDKGSEWMLELKTQRPEVKTLNAQGTDFGCCMGFL